MTNVAYALIARDGDGKRLAVVGTSKEPTTKHGKVQPKFHSFCLSFLALYPAAVSVDTVSWHPGIDLEQAPVLLIARPTELAGSLAYSFPEPAVEKGA
jgi:hypothetical protein